MEGDGIGVVLARASELRSKITGHINREPTVPQKSSDATPAEHELRADEADGVRPSGHRYEDGVPEEEEEEEERGGGGEAALMNIRDALESVEHQLSSLQALQQQQEYEREAALSEIEKSRKVLLGKLNEYRGEELGVIRDVSAFASETVEHGSDDLVLPPYPTRPPSMLDGGFRSRFRTPRRVFHDGAAIDEAANGRKEAEGGAGPAAPINSMRRMGHFLAVAARTVATVIGVVAVLNLAGLEPRLRRREGTHFQVFGGRRELERKGRGSTGKCPPEKGWVVEAKERVEVPLEAVVAEPDVNYGFG